MTASTDLDRLVAAWLAADGPTDVRPDVVDGALVRARRYGQRRGLPATALGPGAWPASRSGNLRRFAMLAAAAALGVALLGGVLLAGALLWRDSAPFPWRVFVGRGDGLYAADASGAPEHLLVGGRRVLQVRASPSGRYVAMRYVPTSGPGDYGWALAAIVDADGRPTGPPGPAGSLAAVPQLDGIPVSVGDIAWAPAPIDGHELLAMTTGFGVAVVDEAGSLVLEERATSAPGSDRAGVAWSKPDAEGGLRLAWGSGSTIWLTSFTRAGSATTRRLVDLEPLDEAAHRAGRSSLGGGDVTHLAITPDGSRIAAVISTCGFSCAAGLWVVQGDGTARLLDGRARTDTWLSIGPDGRSVLAGLWGETDAEPPAMHLVPLDGGGRGALGPGIPGSAPPSRDLYAPRTRWAAGGHMIVGRESLMQADERSDVDPGSLDLWAVRPEGSGAHRLATDALDVDLAPLLPATPTPPQSPVASPAAALVEELGVFTDRQISGFGSALLRDGRVLLVGGVDTTAGAARTVAEAWVFDPTSKRIVPTGALTRPRIDPHLVTLADGRVLVLGGYLEEEGQAPLSAAELYDPAAGTFRSTEEAPDRRKDQPCGALNAVPWTLVRASLLPDGRVFVSGGNAEGCTATKADLFDPTAERWTQLDIGCDAARGAQALLADGRLLVVCVHRSADRAMAAVDVRARLFDPATDTFAEAAAPLAPVWQAAVLADGRVLLTGRTPMLYDPAANAYLTLPEGPHPIGEAGIEIGGGRLLFLSRPALVFDPGSGAFTELRVAAFDAGDADAVVRLRDGRILTVGYRQDARLLDPRRLP